MEKTNAISPAIQFARARKFLGEKGFAAATLKLNETDKYYREVASQVARKNHTKKATFESIKFVVETIKKGRAEKVNRRLRYSPFRNQRAEWVVSSMSVEPLEKRLVAYKQKIWEKKVSPLVRALESCMGYVSHRLPAKIEKLPENSPIESVLATVRVRDEGAYSRSCTFHKIYRGVFAKVLPNWNESVEQRGLTELHGLVTLHVQTVESERPNEEIFRAVWARKTQGANFTVETGYIIRKNEEATHGKTVAGARSVLTRRETEKQLDRLEGAIYQKLEAGEYGSQSDLIVTISDSLKAGNCESGTLAFRDKHFPNMETATVKEILNIAQTNWERRFAIAACMKAIRRNGLSATVCAA